MLLGSFLDDLWRGIMVLSPLLYARKRDGLSFATMAIVLIAFAVVFLSPDLAMASTAASMGDVFCNAFNNLKPFGKFLTWLAYSGGAFVSASGVYSLQRHSEAPNQTPVSQGLYRLLGASLLLSLPATAGMVITTLFGSGGTASGLTTCSAPTAVASGGGMSLDVMMTNLVNNISTPLVDLLSIISMVLGVYLLYQGLLKSSRYGTDPRANSSSSIVSCLVFGAVFMAIGQSLDTMLLSVFGTQTIQHFSDLSWTSIDSLGGNTTQFKTAIKAALTFFQLVGFISFVRGFNVLRNAVEGKGQATVGQGLTHIIGGVLAINIYTFMQIMDTTFGTNFVS